MTSVRVVPQPSQAHRTVHLIRLRALWPLHGARRRTCPIVAINFLLVIHRFDSANSVITCAVFLAKPLNRTFAKPNRRLVTRNGCSILRPNAGLVEPEQVAALAMFLASDVASTISGQLFPIDGDTRSIA